MSIIIQLLVIFAGLFGMPLLFLIAGMAIWYSLSKRTASEFIVERFRRLFIPLIFGVLVIVPPQIWAGVIFDLPVEERVIFFDLEAFFELFPKLFDVTINLQNFPFILEGEYFQTAHLWFLVLLLAFTLILLPFFIYLRNPSHRHFLDHAGDFIGRPWMIFLGIIPLAFIEVILTAEIDFGGWNRYAYVAFIVYGFILASNKKARLSLQRHWKNALFLATITTMVYFTLGIITMERLELDPLTSYDILSIILRIFQGIAGWSWIVTIMGYIGYKSQQGRDSKHPTSESSHFNNFQVNYKVRETKVIDRIGRYATQAQLPFYILHQTVIVIIGFFIVPWEINLYIKFLIISVSSLVGTLILYDIFVKRTRFTRFLFGMKPNRE